MFSTLAFVAALAGTTFALPTAQSTAYDPCDPNMESSDATYTVDSQGIAPGAAFTSGVICPGDGKCTMSLTETYSVSTTITEGVDFGLDIEEIFHAGVSFSVSETTGTSIGEGGSDVCPPGAWSCTLSITPEMVAIGGVQTVTESCGDGSTNNYAILSPHTDTSGNAIIAIAPCACPDRAGWADPGAPPVCPTGCN